jgi:hypothetical protein
MSYREFTIVFFLIVFVAVFLWIFAGRFFSYCIWEWPPRWDVGTCWNEQVDPSLKAASEASAEFMPRLRSKY